MKKHLKTLCRLEILPHVTDFTIIAIVFIFCLLRIPSLIEPEWYGDEGIYQVIGSSLNQGGLLYRDIWDNKPPLLYLYYGLVNGDLFLIKLLSLVFGAAAVVVFFYLSSQLFQKKLFPMIISTSLFAVFFGAPILEGNIANAENFMLFPILLSLFLIIRLTSKSSPFLPITSGLLLSFAFLTKIVAVFDLCAFIVILFSLRFYSRQTTDIKSHFLQKPRNLMRSMRQEALLILAFCIPIVITGLYFLLVGAFGDFMRAAFSQNIGYVGWKNYLQLNLGFINISIPQGILILKTMLLIAAVMGLVSSRGRFSVAALVIYIWLTFSTFNAFFSGRPYTHYILVLLPSLCLLAGLAVGNRKRMLAHFTVFVVIIAFVYANFDYYRKNTMYYLNYVSYVMGQKPVNEYQAFFDGDTPKNYAISQFIKENTLKTDNVMIVSNSSTIYFMANKLPPGRYIVAYHIEFYKNAILETKKALDNKKPKYIISTNDNLAKEFTKNYSLQYILHGVKIYEKQF